jgi:hypothetical protein
MAIRCKRCAAGELCDFPHGTKGGYDNHGCRCGDCSQAKSVASRDYYERNRDRTAARGRDYYERNRDRIAARQRDYYERQRDRIADQQRDYYERNREYVLAKAKRRK